MSRQAETETSLSPPCRVMIVLCSFLSEDWVLISGWSLASAKFFHCGASRDSLPGTSLRDHWMHDLKLCATCRLHHGRFNLSCRRSVWRWCEGSVFAVRSSLATACWRGNLQDRGSCAFHRAVHIWDAVPVPEVLEPERFLATCGCRYSALSVAACFG